MATRNQYLLTQQDSTYALTALWTACTKAVWPQDRPDSKTKRKVEHARLSPAMLLGDGRTGKSVFRKLRSTRLREANLESSWYCQRSWSCLANEGRPHNAAWEPSSRCSQRSWWCLANEGATVWCQQIGMPGWGEDMQVTPFPPARC